LPGHELESIRFELFAVRMPLGNACRSATSMRRASCRCSRLAIGLDLPACG